MTSSFSISKKYSIRFLGTVIYYIFLILNLTSIMAFKLYFGILNPLDLLRIILIFFLCAIPAAPSSFVVSYLNQDRLEGIRTLSLIALIFGIVCLIFFWFFLLPIFFSPPQDQYEALARAGIFLFLVLLVVLFFYPLALISIVLSAAFGTLGYKFLLYRKDSLSSSKLE